MRAFARWLRSGWPLVGVALATVGGAAAGGFGGTALGATFGALVFGPAYLVQNGVRRRRGTLLPPPPKEPVEQARYDARVLQFGAFANSVFAVVAFVAGAIGRGGWLGGRGWTVLLLLAAPLSASAGLLLWTLARRQLRQGVSRRASAVGGLSDLMVGLAAAALAATNGRSHWIGSSNWTAAYAVFAVIGLLGGTKLSRRPEH
jgi:hypothetical protein